MTRTPAQHAAALWLALSAVLLPACSRARTSAPRIGYGTAMADVGRRFELLGRAADAGRYELAGYELGELQEVFAATLPHACRPKEGHPEVVPGMASAFVETEVPDLERALTSRDRARVSAAFARTATACNGCHVASGHAFIEVPAVMGHAVPDTDPALSESP